MSDITSNARFLASGCHHRYPVCMGEFQQQGLRRARIARRRSGQQTPEAIARRLLEIVVYYKCCRVGGKLTLGDLVETSEVGDWKMPDFKAACSYAASRGWLIVRDAQS